MKKGFNKYGQITLLKGIAHHIVTLSLCKDLWWSSLERDTNQKSLFYFLIQPNLWKLLSMKSTTAFFEMTSKSLKQQARRSWNSYGNRFCIRIILSGWNFKSKSKIRPTLQAENLKTVAYFLAERCGDCANDSLTAYTFWGVFANLDGPERGASMADQVHFNISSQLEIERRSGTALCWRRLTIICNLHWVRTGNSSPFLKQYFHNKCTLLSLVYW